jgi:hypothetical protein
VFFALFLGPKSGIRKGERIYDVKPMVAVARRGSSIEGTFNEEEKIDGD